MTSATAAETPSRTTDPRNLLENPQFLTIQSPAPPPPPPSRRSPRRSPTPRPSRTRRPSPETSPAGVSSAVAAEAEPEGPTVRQALQELSDAGAAGAAKKRSAGEADWGEFLGAAVGFLSMLLVLGLVVGTGMSKGERRTYELTDEEADNLAAPAARILARSWVNARWGKHILGGADWILMALTLTDYTERISPLVRVRLTGLRRSRSKNAGADRGRSGGTSPSRPPQEERDGVVARPTGPPGWQSVPVLPGQLT